MTNFLRDNYLDIHRLFYSAAFAELNELKQAVTSFKMLKIVGEAPRAGFEISYPSRGI